MPQKEKTKPANKKRKYVIPTTNT